MKKDEMETEMDVYLPSECQSQLLRICDEKPWKAFSHLCRPGLDGSPDFLWPHAQEESAEADIIRIGKLGRVIAFPRHFDVASICLEAGEKRSVIWKGLGIFGEKG